MTVSAQSPEVAVAIKDMTSNEIGALVDRRNVAIKCWDLAGHYAGKRDPLDAATPFAMASEIQAASNWLWSEWYKHR